MRFDYENGVPKENPFVSPPTPTPQPQVVVIVQQPQKTTGDTFDADEVRDICVFGTCLNLLCCAIGNNFHAPWFCRLLCGCR